MDDHYEELREFLESYSRPPIEIDLPEGAVRLRKLGDAMAVYDNDRLLPQILQSDGFDFSSRGGTALMPFSIYNYLRTVNPDCNWQVEPALLDATNARFVDLGRTMYNDFDQRASRTPRQQELWYIFRRGLPHDLAMTFYKIRLSLRGNWIEEFVRTLASGGGILVGYMVDSFLQPEWRRQEVPDLLHGRPVVYFLPESPNALKN